VHTVAIEGLIDGDGHLRLDIPVDLPPGPVDVVVIIGPERLSGSHDIRELRGLGKEVWAGMDAQKYVSGLRDEWER
jgi:hypothetical protein